MEIGTLIITSIVNWALIVIGWSIVARHSQKRSLRDEAKQDLVAVSKQVERVEELFVEYWTKKEADNRVSLRLKRELGRMVEMVGRLDFSEKSTGNLLLTLRQMATGGDFESASRQALDPAHARFSDFAAEVEKLLTELQRLFNAKHP